MLYIFYIHPELRISNCRIRSGKGARGSTGAEGSTEGAPREQEGAVQGRSRWEPKISLPAFGLSCPRSFFNN